MAVINVASTSPNPLSCADGGPAKERISTEPIGVRGPERQSPAQDKNSVSHQFEELLFKQVVEDMLPKGSGDLYGGGVGASIWRSMFADGIAKELATRSILGLEERMSKLTSQAGPKVVT